METENLPAPLPGPPRPADTDAELIGLWLGRQRSAHTRRSHARNVGEFFAHAGRKPLADVRMSDLQGFAASLGTQTLTGYQSLDGRMASTHARILASVKSLLSFAHRTGYVPFNVGLAVQSPRSPETLNERILSESEILRMIHGEADARNSALLMFLYASGARVSEAVGLRWRDCKACEGERESAHITLFGKGGRSRVVVIPKAPWRAILALREGARADAPVFKSRKGGKPLSASAIWRIVKAAGARAGVEGNVSPHWFRHANASHALQRGCSIEVVRQTLGHSTVATTSAYLHAKPDESSGLYLPI